MEELSLKNKNISPYLIPLSIVIAGALIGGAVFMSRTAPQSVTVNEGVGGQTATEQTSELSNVREVTEEDHIKGNIEAPVKIVEYSDFECPFCKRFHNTMDRVVNEFGDEIAWVYRHFPLQQLHPRNATVVALASECAAEEGGDKMFWEFTDRFFELTPSNDRTDLLTILPKIYAEIGLDEEKMKSCIEDGTFTDQVEEDFKNAVATGGRGTPWSIVIAPNGKIFPLNGAQPYEAVNQLVELALQEQ